MSLVESEPVVDEPVTEGELVFLWRYPPGDSAPRPTASPALVVAEEPNGDTQGACSRGRGQAGVAGAGESLLGPLGRTFTEYERQVELSGPER